MLVSDAVAHFGNRLKIAEVLTLSRSAVYAWDEMVPPLQAARLAEASGGALRFEPGAYANWYSRKRERLPQTA
jgi:hypothetical protein